MDEKETAQSTKAEAPAEDTQDGDTPDAGGVLERLDSGIKRLEALEKRIADSERRITNSVAHQMVAGKGQYVKQQEVSEEEKAEKEAAEVLKRYGY